VLIKPDEIETVTEGGIHIPRDEKLAKSDVQLGTLVAVGNQAWKAFSANFTGKPWAKPGDYVLYARFAGSLVEDPFTGEEYRLLNDEDVNVVVTEGKQE
jgi:co-chaperonin GroES (HSP10)